MSDNKIQRIEPQPFAPADAGAETVSVTRPDSNLGSSSFNSRPEPTQRSRLIFTAVLVLIGLAVAVIIIPALSPEQPGFVTVQPDLTDADHKPRNATEEREAGAPAGPQESPWSDAQLLKARRESQELLTDLLGSQELLESVNVIDWAPEEWQEVDDLAREGDALYQSREFDAAIVNYQQALQLSQKIEVKIPELAESSRNSGLQALEQNQVDAAISHLELAILLNPLDTDAQALLSRAEAREQVLALIEHAQELSLNDSDLEQALSTIEEAQSLDPQYLPVTDLLTSLKLQILERDFTAKMSEGFAGLADRRLASATQAFQAAEALKPGNSAALEALQQVEAARLNTERQTSLDTALSQERREEWAAALSSYQSILKRDASLSSAKIGEIRSRARLQLSDSIDGVLNNRLSLQSESSWNQANSTLIEAEAVLNKGPLLSRQIGQLRDALKLARTPVIIKLQSDNLTDVEIYRVGKLGTFSEHAVNLYPGKYVVVGKRKGYRDKRHDLLIDGSVSEVEISVYCTEPI